MIRTARPLRRVATTTALMTALLASIATTTARAQGTAEQREACAPDAVKLCPDTIPDEERTKACMQRHLSELTPRCRAVFEAATGAPPAAETSPRDEAAGAPPPPAAYDPMEEYRATIAENCREGLIDPFTCRNTLRTLRGE